MMEYHDKKLELQYLGKLNIDLSLVRIKGAQRINIQWNLRERDTLGRAICPLYRGCPLLRDSNCIILIGRDKFGDLVLSFVERYLIQCPFLGGSSLRGTTVYNSTGRRVSWDKFQL